MRAFRAEMLSRLSVVPGHFDCVRNGPQIRDVGNFLLRGDFRSDLIGSVKVIEEGEHIIAEIDGARLWMTGGTLDVTHGAQERT